VQVIPPIALRFFCSVICLSVCLSSVIFVLKPFDRFKCHLARTLLGSKYTVNHMGVPGPLGEREILWVKLPARTCKRLFMISQMTASISDLFELCSMC